MKRQPEVHAPGIRLVMEISEDVNCHGCSKVCDGSEPLVEVMEAGSTSWCCVPCYWLGRLNTKLTDEEEEALCDWWDQLLEDTWQKRQVPS